jgi:hypothetical protein
MKNLIKKGVALDGWISVEACTQLCNILLPLQMSALFL